MKAARVAGESRTDRGRDLAAILGYAAALGAAVVCAIDSPGWECDYPHDSWLGVFLCLHPRLFVVISLAILTGIVVAVGRRARPAIEAVPLWVLIPILGSGYPVWELRTASWRLIPPAVLRHQRLVLWVLFSAVAASLLLASRWSGSQD